jgi:hypothetical protein
MLTFVLKISPDGVQSYVSRPCAQGRLFCFRSTPRTHMTEFFARAVTDFPHY